MPILSYRDLIVWQKGIVLVTRVYELTAHFPNDERFGLVAQLRRASISVPANIAEGHGRATRGEYLNQLSVARGSLNEITTLLFISERLGFAARDEIALLTILTDELGRSLARLRQRLLAKRTGSVSHTRSPAQNPNP